MAHDLPTDVDGLLVLRAFELWAHLDDVCRAIGRDRPAVEPARLAFMSTRLAGAAPLALLLEGEDAPDADVRFVLTGPGGGCHDVAFGNPSATDRRTLTLVADTEAVCRVASRRLAPDALDVTVVDGDERDAARIVRTLGSFARD
jgi:hypothetical protein